MKMRGKVAWSNYFDSFIKIHRKITNSVWWFVLCDVKGNQKGVPMRARAKISDFTWV